MKRKYSIGDIVKAGRIVGVPEDLPGFYNIECLDCGAVRIKSPRKSGCKSCNVKNKTWARYSIGDMTETGVIVDYHESPGKFVIECSVCGNAGVRYATSRGCQFCWDHRRAKYVPGKTLDDGRKIIDVDRTGKSIKIKVACKYCNEIVWKYTGSLNSKCSACRYKSRVDKHANNKLSVYKAGAFKRNYIWEISDEYAKEMFYSKCFYCGALPIKLNGIDRMDNTIGYEIGNVVPCCKTCNYAKRDMSYSEWSQWLQRVSLAQVRQSY
jgi:hypothetical protein